MSEAPIHRLSIPNPFFEGRNSVYVIRTDPITLIDTGVATSKAFGVLQDELKGLKLAVTDIRQVILTHKHIDHIGNAWRLQQASDATILMHDLEKESITDIDPAGDRFARLVDKRLKTWGAPQTSDQVESASKMPKWELEPAIATGVQDGQTIPMEHGELQFLHTPGHTLGSICIRYENQLFSGDHVLEKLSPNIGAGDLRQTGMLRRYMESLNRIAKLEAIETVLPGHGEPFSTLKPRCEELLLHHQQRLDKLKSILETANQTVYEIAIQLFGEMNDFHVMLGCAEAYAHLEYLQERSVAQQSDGRWNLNVSPSS